MLFQLHPSGRILQGTWRPPLLNDLYADFQAVVINVKLGSFILQEVELLALVHNLLSNTPGFASVGGKK